MKRVFIIHGWGGAPDEGVFPWLKKELQKRGFEVFNPAMPNPLEPRIDEWVPFLAKQVDGPDEDTYLVGHSIGVQAILRYVASLPEESSIGGTVFLAGWLNLTDAAYEDDEDREIGRPWRETPIDWANAKKHVGKVVAIFSDNDPAVPLSDKDIFREKLSAEIIVEHDKEHFSGSTGIKELPSILGAVLKMAGETDK